jgi:hypothetical protein
MNKEDELLRALGAALSLLNVYGIEFKQTPFFEKIKDWPGNNIKNLSKMIDNVYYKYQSNNYNYFQDLVSLEAASNEKKEN